MRTRLRALPALLAAFCLAAAALLMSAPAAPALDAAVTVTNGGQFTTTNGSPVHAHGGGIIKVGSWYYWFGEHRTEDNRFRYVDCYRSQDLKNWEFRNHVLTQSSAAELANANIERPKVMYNSANGTFVMWMHKENGSDYSEARAGEPQHPERVRGEHRQQPADDHHREGHQHGVGEVGAEVAARPGVGEVAPVQAGRQCEPGVQGTVRGERRRHDAEDGGEAEDGEDGEDAVRDTALQTAGHELRPSRPSTRRARTIDSTKMSSASPTPRAAAEPTSPVSKARWYTS